MSAPRFTIRRLLWITTLGAVVAWVSNMSRLGAIWAQTLIFVLLIVGISFLGYAVAYGVTLVVTNFWELLVRPERRPEWEGNEPSPFAEHRPPPQWLPPEEPV